MISNSPTKRPSIYRSTRDIILIMVVFMLLALLIWRWFDYRIAKINQLPPSNVIGCVMTEPFPSNLKL